MQKKQSKRAWVMKAAVALATCLLISAYLLISDARVARLHPVNEEYTLTETQLNEDVWLLNQVNAGAFSIALEEGVHAYLSIPSGHAGGLTVNGEYRQALNLDTRVLVQLDDGVNRIALGGGDAMKNMLHMGGDQLQVGLLEKLIQAEKASRENQGFFNGFFIFSILFALTLFVWKPSETYLLIYVLHALVFFSMNISTLLQPLTALVPGFSRIYSAFEQAWAVLNRYGVLSLFYPLFTAIVHWMLFRVFVDDRIFGVRYPVYLGGIYVLMAAAMAVTRGQLDDQWMFFLFYFLVYLCEGYILLINTPREDQYSFSLILLVAWCASFIFWIVRTATNLGFIDYASSMGSLIAMSYTIGFLVCINGKFSHKFLLADQLLQKTQDINERLEELVEKKTEDLKASYADLEQVQKEKNEFVSNIIHNLKTPLFSLKGYAELLSEEIADQSEAAKEYLSLVCGNVDYAQEMIRHLLLFSRLEEKRIVFRKIDFDLAAMLRRMADECRVRLQEKNLRVHVDVDDDCAALCGDELYLRQAVQNIVDNAIEHSRQDGEIRISCTRADGDVAITIRDFGAGINADVLPHIMERCYSYHQNGQKSSGLGLNIAQAIAAAHGGKIEVDSTPGEGSSFTLLLPADQAQEEMDDEL